LRSRARKIPRAPAEWKDDMNEYTLERFIGDCRDEIPRHGSPAECVDHIAPCMLQLLRGAKPFLEPQHYRSSPEQYARNAIYIDPKGTMSLFALVWLPGQWTPVHDHGTWGVVGIIEGTLTERNFIRTDAQDKSAMHGIGLARGGVILLAPGAVTSFVPNPDHIHVTGNADQKHRVVSLHLYGHAMAGFNIYDRASGTRKWVEVSHNES
jgi:3-mercaptopropionate dioxygenase